MWHRRGWYNVTRSSHSSTHTHTHTHTNRNHSCAWFFNAHSALLHCLHSPARLAYSFQSQTNNDKWHPSILHSSYPVSPNQEVTPMRTTLNSNFFKQNKTKQNKTKRNKTKQNKTKQNSNTIDSFFITEWYMLSLTKQWSTRLPVPRLHELLTFHCCLKTKSCFNRLLLSATQFAISVS